MVGRITPTPEALLEIKVTGPTGRARQVESVVDTGFTDFLTLPASLVAELGLVAMDVVECQLADGRIVSMESFAATVQWHGSPRDVLVLATEGDSLAGMSLLYGSRVTMDVVADGEFRIEPVA